MALDRTWYNSLIDDDGSGLTGSVWDKADVDALMDAIDTEFANRVEGIHKNACKLSNSITVSWGSGVWASMGWGTEHFDPIPMHNPNEPAIYLAGPGVYYADAQCTWPESNAGWRGMGLIFNGALIQPPGYQFVQPFVNGLAVGVTQRMSTLIQVTGGLATMEMQLYQNSGVPQNIPPGLAHINVFRVN
jgi:hypothetical protein